MSSVINYLPPAIRDNLGMVTFVAGATLVIAFSNYSQPSAERKKSVEKPQRTLDDLPKFTLNHANSSRLADRRVSVAGESVNMNEVKSSTKIVIPKNDETKARIQKILGKTLLFRNIEPKQFKDIIDAMKEVKVAKGQNIITQGDEGDNFYVVDSGRFDIFVNDKKVAESKSGDSFGELALLYGQPRAATVQAMEDSVCWAVDRTTFRRVVMGSNLRKRQKHETFLKSVPLLSSLNPEELSKAADALQLVHFSAGDLIIDEGEIGDIFYIIEDGEVVITKTNDQGEKVEVGRKTKGDYFGEIALLNDGVRVASVTAITDVECLILDKPSFVRLLGPCVDILKRNMSNYQQYRSHLE